MLVASVTLPWKYPYKRTCMSKKNGSSQLLGAVTALSRKKLDYLNLVKRELGKQNEPHTNEYD